MRPRKDVFRSEIAAFLGIEYRKFNKLLSKGRIILPESTGKIENNYAYAKKDVDRWLATEPLKHLRKSIYSSKDSRMKKENLVEPFDVAAARKFITTVKPPRYACN